MSCTLCWVMPSNRRASLARWLALAIVCCALVISSRAQAQDAGLTRLLQRADSAYAKGDYRRAANLFDRAIASRPRDITAAAYAKRASIFLLRNRAGEGVRWIEGTAESAYPSDPGIRTQKALLLSRIPGKLGAAVRLAEAVLKQRPASAALRLLLGDHYLRRGKKPARAASHYQTFLRVRPTSEASFDKRIDVKLGFAQLLAGRPALAERAFSTAMAVRGDKRLDILARRGLCAAARMRKQWRKARALCTRAVQDGNKRPDAASMRHLVWANLGLNRLGSALKAAVDLGLRHPRRASSHLLLAEVLVRRKDWDRALARFRRALTLAPKHPVAMRRIGQIDLDRAPPRPAAALATLRAAARAYPGDAAIHFQLTRALFANGRHQEVVAGAEPTATRYIKQRKREPFTARLLWLSARSNMALGKPALAAAHAEAAARLGHPHARPFLLRALNDLAVALVTKKDLGRALAPLRRAHRIAPTHARTARNLAAVLLDLSKFEEARKVLTPFRSSTDAVLLRLLARAIYRPRSVKARTMYERALAATSAKDKKLRYHILVELSGLQTNIDTAVGNLKRAAALGISEHAKNLLAWTQCARGLKRMRSGKLRAAASDLDAASRALSKTAAVTKPCRFLGGLANLELGRTRTAMKLLRGLEPGSKWVSDVPLQRLLIAYVDYRIGTPKTLAKARRALLPLTRVESKATASAKSLLGAVYEATAYRYAVAGRRWLARTTMLKARRYLPAKRRAAVTHNLLVQRMRSGAAKGVATALRRLGSSPPEALFNRGILADKRGEHAAAVKLWKAAKARGLRNQSLDRWLRIKKELRGL